MEHRDAATLGQFWGKTSGGLPRSLSIWRPEFGWRLRDAGFAGAGQDRSRREIVDRSTGESVGKEEFRSLWQLQFMNHRIWTRGVYPIMETAARGIWSPRLVTGVW